MYLQIIAIALLFCGNTTGSSADHAFYISVIEINHGAHSKEAELTVKVFQDDMQDALRNASQSKEAKEALRFCSDYEEELSNYFEAHMSLYLNDDPTLLRFNACEAVGDVYQLNFTVDCPEEWDELTITADFLMELFPTQSQMVHITHNGDTVTARLTAKHKSHTVSFIR